MSRRTRATSPSPSLSYCLPPFFPAPPRVLWACTLCCLLSLMLLAGCADSAVSSMEEGTLAESARFEGAALGRAGAALPGEYLILFEEGVRDVAGLSEKLTRQHGGHLRFVYRHAVRGFSATLPEKAVEALRRHTDVLYVEQDRAVYALGTQNAPPWGLDRIDQREGRDDTYHYEATGAGVTAYVLDTGIRYTHVDFEGRAAFGFDAFGGDGSDCHGHGTHVSGTIGGRTYGVAKDVRLVAVRVLDCNGSGSVSGVVAGIDFVTEHATGSGAPAVANMSLGGGASTTLDAAVRSSIAAGITYAVAAGNSSADACNYSPARVDEALTAGATTSSDARASYSNVGRCLDLFAPGSSITSAWNTDDTSTRTIGGTSMASPHVAGVAALYLESHQGATPADVASALAGEATAGAISDAGNGSPNLLLYALLGAPSGEPPPDPPNEAPTASFDYAPDDLAVAFDGSGSYDPDGSVTTYAWAFGDGSSGAGPAPTHTYAAAGTYSVTLTVTDDDGATGQATRSVSVTAPPPPPPASALHVGDLDADVRIKGRSGKWEVRITVRIHDDGEGPVEGATVYGTWSGAASGSVSGVTGADGSVTLSTGPLRSGTEVVFVVDHVEHATMAYDAAANHDAEADSDGTLLRTGKK